jgi:hypothetical protein
VQLVHSRGTRWTHRGNKLTPLTAALDAFEAQLQRHSPRAASRLAPGLPRQEIRARFTEAGLTVPDDLVDWFAWHNGGLNRSVEYLPPSPSTSSEPQPYRYHSVVPIGPWWVSDLTYFLDQYRWMPLRAITPDDVDEELRWFPFIATDWGFGVANCTQDPHTSVRCTSRAWDEAFNTGRTVYTITLEQCVRAWTHAMATRRWTCVRDDDITAWISHGDPEDLPDELTLTGLVSS